MVIFGYLLMCMIFGTTFLAIKVGIDAGAPPFFSAGIRFLLAGLILFLWMVWKGRARVSLLFRKEMMLTGMGLTFGTFSTLYWAEQYVASGIAAVLSATGPIMILLLQTSILRQKTSASAMLGCFIGFAGVLLLLLPSVSVEVSLLWVLGCIMILIGEVCYSSGALYSKHVMPRFQDTSPIALNAVQMMYGGAMLLILSLFTERVHIESLLTLNAIVSLLYLIVIGSMMGHSIFYWLVAKTNPVFPSTWLYISPLIALGLGVLLYNEVVSWIAGIGVVTIIIGIVLVNIDALRQVIGKPESAWGSMQSKQ
ncbi:transporter [Aneurinibacillus migulanus]|uniref:Transporter n=1 Tax=Aneurinibacillus migulanus TaxID=47500 RepID=A0A0D1YJ84_ANEMI|nr:EamA family transporter [Aneurinibacillus migulanus]KIV49920.1 transporter [Aneurinibacillus migulanus]KIV58852.1 transporter [Aneurinibacillus migulanus]KON96545.1 transporter [Aneurinibacillus migulanus]KPD04597.1 transporter [Aneurinibacillus migulanus]MCP1358876.1 EamA family transporter [Aneurinibacillus migulanus]